MKPKPLIKDAANFAQKGKSPNWDSSSVVK